MSLSLFLSFAISVAFDSPLITFVFLVFVYPFPFFTCGFSLSHLPSPPLRFPIFLFNLPVDSIPFPSSSILLIHLPFLIFSGFHLSFLFFTLPNHLLFNPSIVSISLSSSCAYPPLRLPDPPFCPPYSSTSPIHLSSSVALHCTSISVYLPTSPSARGWHLMLTNSGACHLPESDTRMLQQLQVCVSDVAAISDLVFYFTGLTEMSLPQMSSMHWAECVHLVVWRKLRERNL